MKTAYLDSCLCASTSWFHPPKSFCLEKDNTVWLFWLHLSGFRGLSCHKDDKQSISEASEPWILEPFRVEAEEASKPHCRMGLMLSHHALQGQARQWLGQQRSSQNLVTVAAGTFSGYAKEIAQQHPRSPWHMCVMHMGVALGLKYVRIFP